MIHRVQPFLIGRGWVEVKDGHESCRAIFDRHYSRRRYRDGRSPIKFVGPGSYIALLRVCGRALFVWRKFIDDSIDARTGDKQQGVNCAVFRNEGGELSSMLILEAEAYAWRKWPGERLYTYVDPKEVRPTMVRGYPVWGWCFYRAGWHFAGLTKGGLHVLEKLAADIS